jgi:hypothetical protein
MLIRVSNVLLNSRACIQAAGMITMRALWPDRSKRSGFLDVPNYTLRSPLLTFGLLLERARNNLITR